MNNLGDIRLFVEAAQLGSLSAAGRKMVLTPAAASARLYARLRSRTQGKTRPRGVRIPIQLPMLPWCGGVGPALWRQLASVARFPDRVPGMPAVTPALALSLAWLFVTAFQRPWYDVMAISLLALYSASDLDWVVLVRLLAGATVYAQAIEAPREPHWLYGLAQFNGTWLTPGVRFLAVVALVWLCVSGRWAWRSRAAAAPGRREAELLPLS